MSRNWFLNVVITLVALLGTITAASAQPVTLEYWTYSAGGGTTEYEQTLDFLERFYERNPNVKVELRHLTGSDIQNAFVVASAAGTAPDVVDISLLDYHDWALNGLLLDLNPFMERDPHITREFWPQWELDRSTVNGGMYEIPFEHEWLVLYYHKGAFAETGLPAPPTSSDNPWPWDEFAQTAQRLTVRGSDGDIERAGLGMSVGSIYRMEPLARMFGGKVYDAVENRYSFASQGTLDAVGAILEMIQSDQSMRPGGAGAGINGMPRGEVGMVIDPQTYADRWLAQRDFSDFGFGSLPSGSAGSYTLGTAFSIGISPQSDYQDLAWRFVKARLLDKMGLYGTDEEIPERYSLAYQVRNKYEHLEFYPAMLENTVKFTEPSLVPWIVHKGYRQVLGQVQQAIGNVFRLEAGIHTLQEAERSANARLREVQGD